MARSFPIFDASSRTMVHDISSSSPEALDFVPYITTRDFFRGSRDGRRLEPRPGDIGPDGIVLVPALSCHGAVTLPT